METLFTDQLHFTRYECEQLPIEFFERCIAFAHHQPKETRSAIWDGVYSAFYSKLLQAVESKDAEALRDALGSIYNGSTLFGMDYGSDVSSEMYRNAWAQMLLAIGRRTGVVALENPAQPSQWVYDPAFILHQLDAKLGITIGLDGAPGMLGMTSERTGFIPYKALEAANGMLVIRSAKRTPNYVLEIGSGQAFLGQLCRHSGIEYHSIDLLIPSIIGAYLTAHGTSMETVWFEGEPEPSGVCCFFNGVNRPDEVPFDVVFNQDSLPEIPRDEASSLLEYVGDALDPKGVFVSINHESGVSGQNVVRDLVSVSGRFEPISRNLAWGRAGYVEEIWRKIERL